MVDRNPDNTNFPPFETQDLRSNLKKFYETPFFDPELGEEIPVGNFKWGVYAFFDYDGEPIYVGQTFESLRQRIGRHLTNQRTDAVAMSVLDPFEVYEIEVWPLPELANEPTKAKGPARNKLDALEHLVTQDAIRNSRFKAILNEKDPPAPQVPVTAPKSYRSSIVSEEVFKIRSHPDFRIARRSLIISRLAQVISEREVKLPLRRVLLTQAKRLQWLANRRFTALGGIVTVGSGTEDTDS